MNGVSQWVMVNIPAPIRHFVAAFVGAFVLFMAQAITTASSLSIDWGSTLKEALIAGIGTVGTLAITPLTDAYGTGATAAKVAARTELQTNIAEALDDSLLPDETPDTPYVEPSGFIEPVVGSQDAVNGVTP
jgi:hypothetical protein